MGEALARFDKGWIVINRKILDSDIMGNPTLFAMWMWLIIRANWKPSKIIWNGKQRVVNRGEIITGTREISEILQCSNSTVKRWLDYLCQSNRIRRESGTRGSLITILNYSEYQDIPEDSRTRTEHGPKADRTRTEHGPNLSEQSNKVTSINGVSDKNTFGVSDDKPLFDFELIYQEFPKRGKGQDMRKGNGMKKCKAQIKTQKQYDQLSLAVKNYAAYVKAEKSKNPKWEFNVQWGTFMSKTYWRDWIENEDQKIKIKSIEEMERDMWK